MATEGTRRIAGGIAYQLVPSKVKNINLRVKKDGTVRVSAAPKVPAAQVDEFVAAHAEWIRQAQARVRAKAAAEAAAPLPDAQQALEQFTRLSDLVYPAFAGVLGGRKPLLKVSSMTSRWGVCYPQRRQITFALQLYNQPLEAQIYVVVHEYCHFLVRGHGPDFWAQVEKLLPDWKARRKLLKQLPPGK